MLHYDKHHPDCVHAYDLTHQRQHVAGLWFNEFRPEKKWTLYFPLSNIHFYFDDEDTLKTFLELHWQEYRT